MKNIVLVQDECALCHGHIDKEWAGEHPSLGTTCRKCFDKRDSLFGPDNVELEVKKRIIYNPLFGTYEYNFDWTGTKIMVNGKVGTLIEANLGSSRYKFPDSGNYGTTISTIDYWRLLEIYKSTGGDWVPPALTFAPYTPTKTQLLDKPLLEVTTERGEDGTISHISVGRHSHSFGRMFGSTELPDLPMFHAFANLYVRYKFGLAPNYCFEGGFHGDDFEVRNSGRMTGGVGLSVRQYRLANTLSSAGTPEELHTLAVTEGLIGLMVEKERSRAGVVKDATVNEILSTWIVVMETLLRYDWAKLPCLTIEDMWDHYCKMQDVLLNIMSPEELAEALAYCQKGKMGHCGSSY